MLLQIVVDIEAIVVVVFGYELDACVDEVVVDGTLSSP